MKVLFVAVGLWAIIDLAHGQNCDPSQQFECLNGNCIPGNYVCDGYNDCGDRSDEVGESGICPKCPSIGWWKCDNGRCIRVSQKCDGTDDCWDWSDETEWACKCDDGVRCPEVPGSGRPGICVPPEFVCDLVWDCPNGEDEANCTRSGNAVKYPVPRLKSTETKNKQGTPQRWYKPHEKYTDRSH